MGRDADRGTYVYFLKFDPSGRDRGVGKREIYRLLLEKEDE